MADKATDPTAKKKAAVLAALRDGDSISAAARAARIHRSTYYTWRDDDPAFADAADDAIEEGTDALEDEAKRRAMTSSDTMLIFLLKGRRRSKYGDKQSLEHSGPGGDPLMVTIIRDHAPGDA